MHRFYDRLTIYPYLNNFSRRIVVSLPAGGMWSTPNDMAEYMKFHLNKGKVNGKQLIPEVFKIYAFFR